MTNEEWNELVKNIQGLLDFEYERVSSSGREALDNIIKIINKNNRWIY